MFVPKDGAGGKVKRINMEGFSTQHGCTVNKASKLRSWRKQHSWRGKGIMLHRVQRWTGGELSQHKPPVLIHIFVTWPERGSF